MGGQLELCNKKFVLIVFFGVLTGLLLFSIPAMSYSSSHDTRDTTKTDVVYKEKINRCEELYPTYKRIGELKFSKRYWSFVWERNCIKLYKHNVWNDEENESRIATLIHFIKQIEGDSTAIKQRHLTPSSTSIAVPDWIKEEAQRWVTNKASQSKFAFLIRYMIDNKIVIPPLGNEERLDRCIQGSLCISAGDFLRYSYEIQSRGDDNKETKDVVTITYSFSKPDNPSEELQTQLSSDEKTTTNDLLLVQTKKASKEGINRDKFYLDKKTGMIREFSKSARENGCCDYYYGFAHPLSLAKGKTVSAGGEKLSVTSEILFPYKSFQRQAVIAQNKTVGYSQVIDKESGIVLHFTTSNLPIQNFAGGAPISSLENEKTERNMGNMANNYNLIDTSVLVIEYKHRPLELQIPSWIKKPTEWWLSEEISDREYVFLIEYLLKKNVLIV